MAIGDGWDDFIDRRSGGFTRQAPMSEQDQYVMAKFPGLSLADAYKAYRIATGLEPEARNSGSGSVDHFYDISPAEQYTMERNARNDERNIANDDREYERNTARDLIDDQRNQRDYDYGVTRDTRTDAQSDRTYNLGVADSQNDYNARMAEIAQSREDSNNNYAIGIANAQNDGEKNNITQRWNEEQSRIAKMEDETEMILGQQSNQTNQFGAETNRATGMGRLALDNNKFIADMASGARGADLFTLWAMQRGMAPDWNKMKAGGEPARGDALAPSSVMSAYTPTTAPPTFNATNRYKDAVGANPYTAKTFVPPPLAGGSGGGGSQFVPPAYVAPQATPMPAAAPRPTPAATPAATPANNWSGIRARDVDYLQSGQKAMHMTGSTGTSRAGDYTNFKVYNSNTNAEYGADERIGADQNVWLERRGAGGFTTAKNILAGDANDPNPNAGGAKPEPIYNPTGAPLYIQPNPNNNGAAQGNNNMGMSERRAIDQPYQYERGVDERYGRAWAQKDNRYRMGMLGDYGRRPDPSVLWNKPRWQNQPLPPQQRNWDWQPQRFALGSGQEAYNAQGMGSSYIPDSENEYLAGQELPPALEMFRKRKMALAPSLANAAMGVGNGVANMGAAFGAYGAGTATSLQGLRNQTKSETELYKGYVEGVNKIPWADYVDWIGKPTESLRGAQRAQG